MSITSPGLRDPLAIADAVRSRQPLVHCITSTVSMAIVADGLLAAGARPMMTETASEAPVVTTIADALLVNLGTLSTDAAAGIEPTVEACAASDGVWVLDPTAIGIAPVRTPLARRLLQRRPLVVRGNASEVMALAGQSTGGRGADSRATPTEAQLAAAEVVAQTGGAVAVSGARDLVVDAARSTWVDGGTPLLTRVTGTGCLLGALTAACCTMAEPFDAAVAASTWMARAGELAAKRTGRPGSFRTALIDALDEVLR